MFSDISKSIDNLSTNISNMIEAFKSIGRFFAGVGEVFNNLTYLIANPSLLMDLLQPFIILLILMLIVLKLIGFKTNKWIRLFLIALFIVIIF